MHTTSITQKRLWTTKTFELQDGILWMRTTDWIGTNERELRYEDIISEKSVRRAPNYWLLSATGFLCWLSCINLIAYAAGTNTNLADALFGLLVSVGMAYVAYQSAQEEIHLFTTKDEQIILFRDPQNKALADAFVYDLLQERKLFLVEKYWDCVDCHDQKMDNLEWLKNRNIVNIEEFKHLKEETYELDEVDILPIGFHRKQCS